MTTQIVWQPVGSSSRLALHPAEIVTTTVERSSISVTLTEKREDPIAQTRQVTTDVFVPDSADQLQHSSRTIQSFRGHQLESEMRELHGTSNPAMSRSGFFVDTRLGMGGRVTHLRPEELGGLGRWTEPPPILRLLDEPTGRASSPSRFGLSNR
jgi:hypothetical protein